MQVTNNKLIVVLGMHRSGTSTITRGLQVLGVDLGDNLLAGVREVNDKGFWEDIHIVSLNEEILGALGSDWKHVSAITARDVEVLRMKGYLLKASELLKQKLFNIRVFGFKDPRVAKLLPFWKSVFSHCGLDVSYVLAVRHPLSVAMSLAKRDALEPEQSYLLWLNHVVTSLAGSLGNKQVVIDYDRFLQCPERELNRIATAFDLKVSAIGLEKFKTEFVDENLRHTYYDLNDLLLDDACPPIVQELYAALLEITSGEISFDDKKFQTRLVRLSNEFERMRSPLVLVDRLIMQKIAMNEAAKSDHYEQMITLNRLIAERDSFVDRANLMEQSISWRMTRPVRFVVRLVRKRIVNEDRKRLTQMVRHYYHRLPLPIPAKKAMSFIYHKILRKVILGLRRNTVRAAIFKAPNLKPVSRLDKVADYVVWGVIDWNFRHQRPQQLALALTAVGHRLFYISPNLIDDGRAGFEVEALDSSGLLFQIRLFVGNAPVIYSESPNFKTVEQLRKSIGEVLDWADCGRLVSLVQHPFWFDVASVLPNSRLVYDCMDFHEGFTNTDKTILMLEKNLFNEADLTITTSTFLESAVAEYTERRALIRNGGDFTYFSKVPETTFREPKGCRIIGYYGAIAEWFDLDLVEAVAKRHPECCVLLIGTDSVNAKSQLGNLPNVTFVGEVPYVKLTYYLYSFDLCLLPFKILPLTIATNPVKVYEYLSAGKPVVSVDLPELVQFDRLIYVASDKENFLHAVDKVLAQAEEQDLICARREFAQCQTWKHRAEALIELAESSSHDPSVSIIIVTYNNLELTRTCLASIEEYSQYGNLELIVVDNASSDGSKSFFEGWVSQGLNRKLILNKDNSGFAAANNQGLNIASGDFLILLNNDTYVTPGWIRTLVNHLKRDKTIGLIGPVTNNIGNEAKLDIDYNDMTEMLVKSSAYTRRHIGKIYPLRTVAFFCVMMSRNVFEKVGPLDEKFGRGFFEDDDYCRRAEQLGLRAACAEDVFVHHELSASFSKINQKERQQLFDNNEKIYSEKWGAWTAHEYRKHHGKANFDQSIPAVFLGQKYVLGQCNVCGKQGRFFYQNSNLWRETLNCEHCRTTSRYRSISKGILRAIGELTGKDRSPSLVNLPSVGKTKLHVYDTQTPFYRESCAYPIPDLLKASGWIDVELSQYKPNRPFGKVLAKGTTNQNLECLTFGNESFDIVITSDVMEHVRLDARAHQEIYRVLKPGGIYIFTVPNVPDWDNTLLRVQINDPDDPSKDVNLLEPEYHGDTNSGAGGGILAYRTYGRDLEVRMKNLGFEIEYIRDDDEHLGILNTELYYCKKPHHGSSCKDFVAIAKDTQLRR